MKQKQRPTIKDIESLTELQKEIDKYQGLSGHARHLFGLDNTLIGYFERGEISQANTEEGFFITGKLDDETLKIHKFGRVLKIEKKTCYSEVQIIRYIDNNLIVHFTTTLTNYKIKNKLFLDNKEEISRCNASLVCDLDGNFIQEEMVWNVMEPIGGKFKGFKPFVEHTILQASGEEYVLRKSCFCYYDKNTPDITKYRRYVLAPRAEGRKVATLINELNEETYCKLLEDPHYLEKQENRNNKQKLKDRIFKHKA